MNPLTTADDIDHAAHRQDRATTAAAHRHDATRDAPRLTAFDRIAELAELIDAIDASLASPWMTCPRDAAYQRRRREVLADALAQETKQLRGRTVVAVSEKRAAYGAWEGSQ